MKRNLFKSGVERIQRFLYRLEDSILSGVLLLIISMAVVQILLRNLFEGGIVWGDMLVRVLVLWIGLIGAMVASRNGSHISIDVVTRFLPHRAKSIISCVVELFTSAVCALMAYFSMQFVWMEFKDGGTVIARVPAWACEAIIPFAFAVIALRYFILSIMNLTKTVKPPS